MDDSNPRKRRSYSFRLQFSLRSLIVVIVLVSLASSWFAVRMHEAREQARSVAAIRDGGGDVYYENQCDEGLLPRDPRDWPAPSFLENVLGKDIFGRVVLVDFRSGAVIDDDMLEHLRQLESVRRLELYDTTITESAMPELSRLHSVTILSIGGPGRTVEDLGGVVALPRLRRLFVYCASVTPDALSQLGAARELRFLLLSATELTEDNIAALCSGSQLEELFILGHTNTVSLQQLESLTQLEELQVFPYCWHPGEDSAIESLARALPNTKVTFKGQVIIPDRARPQLPVDLPASKPQLPPHVPITSRQIGR